MNRVGMLEFVWLRLRRLPRSVWIAGALAMLILPALLLWLALSLFGNAWQVGSAWLGQSREALQSALPANVEQLARELPNAQATLGTLQSEAQQRVKEEVERLGAAIPASAEALQQGLIGAALPAGTEGLRQLAQQVFSHPLPLEAVTEWLRGARPELAGEVDGWRVAITESSIPPAGKSRLLRVMEAGRGDVEFKLIVDDWELPNE